MKRVGYLALIGLLIVAGAIAETAPIGTASARGSLRVDGYLVNGNATLFDGTVVETERAATALRAGNGIEIKLAADSRGTLYRDRLVLDKGAGEVAVPRGFLLEASDLRVTADGSNSHGVIALKQGHQVQVSALSGAFEVKNSAGVLLASVRPGNVMLFSTDAAGAIAPSTYIGTLIRAVDNCSADGKTEFYLKDRNTGVNYEVTGENLAPMIGKTIVLVGTLDPAAQSTRCAAGELVATKVSAFDGDGGGSGGSAPAGIPGISKKLIGGLAVAGGAGTGVGIYEANQSSTPASR